MLPLVLSIVTPLGVGMVIGIGLRDSVKQWYPSIRKPVWYVLDSSARSSARTPRHSPTRALRLITPTFARTPPNYLFGPVWTALYVMMGVASHRVASIVGWTSKPLVLYASQLVLNFLWSPLFFKWHKLGAAAADITVLLGVVYATIVEFGAVDVLSAQLLVPYLCWSCYATALTYNIWLNN